LGFTDVLIALAATEDDADGDFAIEVRLQPVLRFGLSLGFGNLLD